MRPAAFLALALFLTGCTVVLKPSPAELAALDAPPPDIAGEVDRLAPKALKWIADTAQANIGAGRPLSPEETAYAREIGILRPESVRVIVAERFPVPDDADLRRATEAFGMGGLLEGGRTLGHIVFLKPTFAGSKTVLSHELNHVAQFDRLGEKAMVRRYIAELLMLGYARSPLELEAYEKQVSAFSN